MMARRLPSADGDTLAGGDSLVCFMRIAYGQETAPTHAVIWL